MVPRTYSDSYPMSSLSCDRCIASSKASSTESAMDSSLQCGESCVIIDLDAVTPYLMDKIKTVFAKIRLIYCPPILLYQLCEFKNDIN